MYDSVTYLSAFEKSIYEKHINQITCILLFPSEISNRLVRHDSPTEVQLTLCQYVIFIHVSTSIIFNYVERKLIENINQIYGPVVPRISLGACFKLGVTFVSVQTSGPKRLI